MSSTPFAVAAIYALASVAWIVLSDRILVALAGDFHRYQEMQTYKGMVFVTGSALLIFFLLHFAMRQIRKAYDAVEIGERRLTMALGGVRGGAWEVELSPDDEVRQTFVSSAFLDAFGLDQRTPNAIDAWVVRIHPDDRAEAVDQLRHCLRSPGRRDYHAVYRFLGPSGEYLWLEAWGGMIADRGDGVRRMVGVVLDNTRQVLAEEQLERLMRYDAQTGLPLPQKFVEDVDAALAGLGERQSLALFHLRLDGAGLVDDDGRDAVRAAIVERLKELAAGGCAVTRFAENDYGVATPPLGTAREAHDWLNSVLDLMSGPMESEGRSFAATFAVGACLCPDDGRTAASAMRKASHALSMPAAPGETRVQWSTEGIDAQYLRRSALIRDMRGAVESGEIVCHFQPLVDVHRGVTCGFEALVRWQRADGTLVMPGEFVPLAEQFGAIGRIGEEVLRQACAAAASWQNLADEPPFVAVNVSPVQLASPTFPSLVARVLEETGLGPARLELEITESMLMTDSLAVARRLGDLRELGIAIAIDDFGTGYSSLSLLGRLPFTRLKIDRSFTGACMTADDIAAIVDTIIGLARKLDLEVTAEGVETVGQMVWMGGRGVDVAQGFLLSRPVPRAVADTLVRRCWFDANVGLSPQTRRDEG
jgi:PAS domain S-box-containing protein